MCVCCGVARQRDGCHDVNIYTSLWSLKCSVNVISDHITHVIILFTSFDLDWMFSFFHKSDIYIYLVHRFEAESCRGGEGQGWCGVVWCGVLGLRAMCGSSTVKSGTASNSTILPHRDICLFVYPTTLRTCPGNKSPLSETG